MPLPSFNTSPERIAELERILTLPRKPAKELSSLERILRVNLIKEMQQAGIDVPEEELSYGIELLTVDRTDRASAIADEKKAIKKALKGDGPVTPPGGYSASDL